MNCCILAYCLLRLLAVQEELTGAVLPIAAKTLLSRLKDKIGHVLLTSASVYIDFNVNYLNYSCCTARAIAALVTDRSHVSHAVLTVSSDLFCL